MSRMTGIIMGRMTNVVMGRTTGIVIMGQTTSSVMGHTTNIMVLISNSKLQVTRYQFKAGKRVVIPGTSCSAAINLKVLVKRVFQWIRVL